MRTVLATCLVVAGAILGLTGCSTSNPNLNPSANGAPKGPLIYVTNFYLDASQIEQQKMPIQERLPILANRSPRFLNEDPDVKRKKLIRALSESIVHGLKQKGYRAEYLPDISVTRRGDGLIHYETENPPLPREGWLVTGWFEKVEEGNAALEATVGFGVGAGQVEAQVVAADLARDPSRPFLYMGSKNLTNKMPGGVVTLNPYVMAAKFVIDRRHGTERDVQSMGKQIAKSLLDYIDKNPAPPGQKTAPITQ